MIYCQFSYKINRISCHLLTSITEEPDDLQHSYCLQFPKDCDPWGETPPSWQMQCWSWTCRYKPNTRSRLNKSLSRFIAQCKKAQQILFNSCLALGTSLSRPSCLWRQCWSGCVSRTTVLSQPSSNKQNKSHSPISAACYLPDFLSSVTGCCVHAEAKSIGKPLCMREAPEDIWLGAGMTLHTHNGDLSTFITIIYGCGVSANKRLSLWPCDELATCLGCYPALTQWQLAGASADTRQPRVQEEVGIEDGWLDGWIITVNVS